MNIKQYKELTKPLEKHVLHECEGLMRSRGYYVMRLNSGTYQLGFGKNKRFVRGMESGTPDLMGFKLGVDNYDMDVKLPGGGFAKIDSYCDVTFVECKREGESPTELQEAKMRELEAYGARCLVAHSASELEQQL